MNTVLRFLPVCFLCFCALRIHGQISGGQHVFEHLSISPSARITALGGAVLAVSDKDVSLALTNPAALNAEMSGSLSFQHQFYLADLQSGAFSGARYFKKLNITAQTGIQYLNYGSIPESDEFGNKTGKDVVAKEFAWTTGASRQLSPKLSIGLNLKLASANFAEYQSIALLADAGMMFSDTSRRFTATLALKNRGAQLSTFQGTRESLPYDLQFGITKRLRYLPFRVGLVLHHLQTWNLRYDDPNDATATIEFLGQEQTSKGNPTIDNAFRHIIVNGEFILGKSENFFIRFGYNHLRKRELSVTNLRSLAGFSAGIGLKVKRFQVDMGMASWHLAGGGFHLGLRTDIDRFIRS